MCNDYYYNYIVIYHPTEENLSSGEVQVSLNYGNIPIVNETLDLCDLVIQIGEKCPLNKKRIKFKVTKSLPDYIPSVSLCSNAIGSCMVSDDDDTYETEIIIIHVTNNYYYMYFYREIIQARCKQLIRAETQ